MALDWVSVAGRVEREAMVQRYVPQPTDPLYRHLRAYAIDPAVPDRNAREVTVTIPFEPLEPGPAGALFEVVPFDIGTQTRLPPTNLDTPAVLIERGFAPSLANRDFLAQMAYGIAMSLYETFRVALGRDLPLGIREDSEGNWIGGAKLRLFPFGPDDRNAAFDRDAGIVFFGSFAAEADAPLFSPKSRVYTCLSHDVLVHEIAHALLDSTRPNFMLPTHPDVQAFHEAFADLIAVFQRFAYADLVRSEIASSCGQPDDFKWLSSLATSFARTTGIGDTLRDVNGCEPYDRAPEEPHARGTTLVQAVFRAFKTVLRSRFAERIAVATGGSGVLPDGALSGPLTDDLANETRKTAQQFLRMIIRALDYCPPFGIMFDDFLRAVITADRHLVPDDDRGYRAAWIEAFRTQRIYPQDGTGESIGLHLTEEALPWPCAPPPPIVIDELSYGEMRFSGDPGKPPSGSSIATMARAIAAAINAPGSSLRALLRLFDDDEPPPEKRVEQAHIYSVRPLSRIGPDQQLLFGTVAEIVRHVPGDRGNPYPRLAGATLLFDSTGQLVYLIGKPFDDAPRMTRERAYIDSRLGRHMWMRNEETDAWTVTANVSTMLCTG